MAFLLGALTFVAALNPDINKDWRDAEDFQRYAVQVTHTPDGCDSMRKAKFGDMITLNFTGRVQHCTPVDDNAPTSYDGKPVKDPCYKHLGQLIDSTK